MPTFKRSSTIVDVHRIKRPGIGSVYQGKITIGELARALMNGDIRYAPKYQRGLKQSDENTFDNQTLLDISNERLLIEKNRAYAMACKYLMALNGEDIALYNPDVIWNARAMDGVEQPTYDEKSRTLEIHSNISIPDSAHRHYLYFTLYQWKLDPDSIPEEVVISEDGNAVDNGDIQEWIKSFDPENAEESSVLVQVFNLTSEREGKLFDEYNVEGKQPSKSASIDMFPDKTASRRFITALMKRCQIFGESEVETRFNTIGSASRKITTISTLDVAIKPFNSRLLALEKEFAKGKYSDLVDFVAKFWEEWANHFPEFQPTASGFARQQLRKTSYAMSNIMFFPLFRIAFDTWQHYDNTNTDWGGAKEWRDALARIAGDVECHDPNNPGKIIRVRIMARDSDVSVGNPDWQGKILVQKSESKGGLVGWTLSSTRQTRDSAYHYLVDKAGIKL